jgi:hypothetical protein
MGSGQMGGRTDILVRPSPTGMSDLPHCFFCGSTYSLSQIKLLPFAPRKSGLSRSERQQKSAFALRRHGPFAERKATKSAFVPRRRETFAD